VYFNDTFDDILKSFGQLLIKLQKITKLDSDKLTVHHVVISTFSGNYSLCSDKLFEFSKYASNKNYELVSGHF